PLLGKVDLDRRAVQGTHLGVIGRSISPARQFQHKATRNDCFCSHQGAHGVNTPGPVRKATAGRGSATRGLRGAGRHAGSTARRERHRRSPDQMALAHTRESRASARGRQGRGASFPTAETAPPTPGHIPR
ncbi:unnamed protein product, partial [Ectocarpus fasciculatus]